MTNWCELNPRLTILVRTTDGSATRCRKRYQTKGSMWEDDSSNNDSFPNIAA
jgi:hypothetical protein